jgi:hypothetical protein
MGRHKEVSEGNPSRDTERRQERFLKAYAACGVVAKASRAAGIDYNLPRAWRHQDILFLERFNAATESYNDHLEEILNDLIEEMHKKLDYKANPTLLIFKMNGAMPEKYKGMNQASGEAKDVLSEFRKAMREAKGTPDPKPVAEEPKEEKSAVDQAREIVEGKFGSLDATNRD